MNTLTKSIRSILFAAAISLGTVSAMAQTPDAVQAGPAVSSRDVATHLADMMASRYVFPEIGERYAQALRARAEAGHYDGLAGKALADRLLADLEGTHPDAHLNVIPDPQAGNEGASGDGAGGLDYVQRDAPDMEPARWLAPGIAYVRYNLFPSGPADIEATEGFLDEYAGAKTIIFDLRTHRGGALGEIDAIFGRLVTTPRHLLTMDTRRSLVEIMGMPPADDPRMRLVEGDPEFISLQHWALPTAGKPRIGARIYLLTSRRTGSAAEHFALAMKVSGLGTLVGEPTLGANHFGGLEQVAGGISAFIPVGRTYDPATGQDWEGVGVAPDVEVAADDALETVLAREGLDAGKARAVAESLLPGSALPGQGG